MIFNGPEIGEPINLYPIPDFEPGIARGKRRYYYQLEPLFGQFSGQVIKKITRIIPIKPGKRRGQYTDLHLYGTCKVSCFFNIVSAYCFVYSRVLSPGLRARAVLMAFKAS